MLKEKNDSAEIIKTVNTEFEAVYQILSKHNPNEIFEIKDLISHSFQGRTIPSSQLIENKYNGNMPSEHVPYIRITELNTESIEYKLDITKTKYCILRTEKMKLIEKSVVLLSLIGKKLKPTYFEYKNKPIFIGNDVLALDLKKDIDIEYFVYQLNSIVDKSV